MIVFSSLARIQILLVPVGSIDKPSFERWASEIKAFEEIRLSDVPSDVRDDRARFMPGPQSTGSLLLSFTMNQSPTRCASLSIFRPSDLVLGVIGIAICSQPETLSTIYSQYSDLLAELFPSEHPRPFARNCFVFDESDNDANFNIGEEMPGLVVIPSMMGNKKLYIGTLLSDLCSNILGEFSVIVKTLETVDGNDCLNAGAFGKFPENQRSRKSLDEQDGTVSPKDSNACQSFADILGSRLTEDTNFSSKRSSTLVSGRTLPNRAPNLSVATTSKTRQSGVGAAASHSRLYKVLGDLFLLSGRTMDASIWYYEAIQGLKQPQDAPWQASALEGLAVAELIEFWSTGPGAQTGSVQGKELWADISEKLTRAIGIYSSVAEIFEEISLSNLSVIYTMACLRLSSLFYFIWLARGWGSLAQEALLRGESAIHSPLDTTAEQFNGDAHVIRLDAEVTRADVSGALAQAHGPWLLHLNPRERIEVLGYITRMYSNLRYRRKEVYCMRELLASLMDLVVQGREELKESPEATFISRDTLDLDSNRALIGIRERDEVAGNASILSLVKYICQIHGVNLDAVKFQDDVPADIRLSSTSSVQSSSKYLLSSSNYSWPNLQAGIVREALAVAEALPDYSAVALFALSALKCLSPYLDGEDQYHFHASATRAMTILRRRGDEREPEYWLSEIIIGIQFVPLNVTRIPHERLSSEMSAASKSDPWFYNPRRVSSEKRQTLAVVNEDMEFAVTIWNPYEIILDIASLSISTSGVPFSCNSLSLAIPPGSTQTLTLTGRALQPGILTVRGCFVRLAGLAHHEALLPVYSQDEEEKRVLRVIAESNEGERAKTPSLYDRLQKSRPGSNAPSKKKQKTPAEPSFLELKVIPVQPSLRIRRTSLTNGAVMLYEGETSMIRFTVENVSTLAVHFLDLSFNDSTIAVTEQSINDGNLNAFEEYEAERSLVHTPVFSWDLERFKGEIAPGQEQIISVDCFGKADCTDGTIRVSYGHFAGTEPSQEHPSTFYVRQLSIPIIVTVYEMLECLKLDVIPTSATNYLHDAPFDRYLEIHGWCLLMLDVRNTYGIPFEVTLSYESNSSTKRVIPAGSTFRLLLPIRQFYLPQYVTNAPIPSPLNRQFVVTDLSREEDEIQKEIFWYREELLKKVHARWKEMTGSRTGVLSLRQQQLTLSMLKALRTEPVRIWFTLSELVNDGKEVQLSSYGMTDSMYRVPSNRFVLITTHVQNLTQSSLVLVLSITGEPDDYIHRNGVWKDISLGRLESQGKREHRAMAVFLSQGYFTISPQVRVIDADYESKIHGPECSLVAS